jgi:hypothetical protein
MVIRKMRGGAQSRLVCAADGTLWVVKFQNNPQHLFVLANEFIATRLAAEVGLSVPDPAIIEVSPWLYANSVDFDIDFGRGRKEPCRPGLHFGSRFIGGLVPGKTVDCLPERQLAEVLNLNEFAGILALDKWTGNCDGRQCVFSHEPDFGQYEATFIDQGFCFNAGDWTFPDSPLRGVYARPTVYEKVTGWESFSPWLERLEEFEAHTLAQILQSVPPEWYNGDRKRIERLGAQLLKRRSRIRDLILSFRNSDRDPFPLWAKTSSIAVPQMSFKAVNSLKAQRTIQSIDSGLQIAKE